MTISSDYAPDLYAGNDLTYSFAFTFPVLAKSDLVVTRIDSVGVETVQVENTNYRVTNWRKPGDTGTVSMGYYDGPTWVNLPIPIGEQIRLSRLMAYTQPTDLVNNQRYLAESVERGLDRLEMQVQQLSHYGVPSGKDHGTLIGLADDDHPQYAKKASLLIRVDDHGAVGDGVTDDTGAVQAAIAAALSLGAPGIRFTRSKTYKLGPLGTQTVGFAVHGDGASLIVDPTTSGTNGAPIFCWSGSVGAAKGCSALTAGTVSIQLTTIADAAGFAAGDYIKVTCTDVVQKWDGSGAVPVPKIEMASVTAVDAGTGVVTVAAPLSYSMTTGVTIAKCSMVSQPSVRDFTPIVEVNPGAPYAGLAYDGPTAPNIVDYSYCLQPRTEDLHIIGWNLQAVSHSYCIGGSVVGVRGERPFHPTTGGTGILVRLPWCRDMLVSRCSGLRIRHLVDYIGSLDCCDEYCMSATDPDDLNAAAFITHGYLSKRIRSLNAFVLNGQGWSIGNAAYAGDSDVVILGYCYLGGSAAAAANAMLIGYATTNVTVVNAKVSSYAGGIRVIANAANVRLLDSIVENLGTGQSAIHIYADTGFYPADIAITGCDVQAVSGTAIRCEASGSVTIAYNKLNANLPITGWDAVAASILRILNNDITAQGTPAWAIGVAAVNDFPPTKIFDVHDNCVSGATSTSALRLRGSTRLRCVGNRAPDSATKFSLMGAVAIRDVIGGGGKIEDNESVAGDLPSSQYYHTISAPNSNSKKMISATNGVWRWGMGGNSVTETGTNNAGTDFELNAYNDAGGYIDAPLYITRNGGGSMSLTRPTLYFGESTKNSDIFTIYRSIAGKTKGLWWQDGTVTRWKFQVNASLAMEIAAHDAAGALIDNPLSIVNAAGGAVTVSRPVVTSSARTVSKQSVVSAAGTTAIAASADAVIVTGTTTHTLTLPAAANGRRLFLKNRSTGAVTVNRAGSDTIDGGTTFNLTAGQGTILIVDGTDWCRMANA